MAKQLKGGYLLRYKKKLFWQGAWKEEWIVLYENSNLVWYKNRDRPMPKGGILISESPELLAVGLWTLRIPNRPENLPHGFHTRQLIAFGTKGQEKVHWFLAKSEDQVNEWMTAISNTLPEPPTRGQNKISYNNSVHKSFEDVITPTHLRNKELMFKKQKSPLGNLALEAKLSSSPQNHLPKSSSSSSIGTTLSSIKSLNNFKANGQTRPHYGSSGQLHSVTNNKDNVASTLAVGTALGVWSHGFGWGWGPGWGWSGWGTNSTPLSLSHPDFSSTIFRTQDYMPMNSTSTTLGGYEGSAATLGPSSTYLQHYDNSSTAANFFDTSGLAGGGDDMSSAFDAFGGDFGF